MAESETATAGGADLAVKVWEHHRFSDVRCHACGEWYEQPAVAAVLVPVDVDTAAEPPSWMDRTLAVLCPDCLAGGPTGAAERARQHAARLRRQADGVGELAGILARVAPDRWLTSDALAALYARVRELRHADLPTDSPEHPRR